MRRVSFFHASFLLAKKKKKNWHLPTMQLQRWRFSRRFRCVAGLAALVASGLEQKMKRAGKAHFLRKLHLQMFFFFYSRTWSLQTQTILTRVTSLGGNSLGFTQPLCRGGGFMQRFIYGAELPNTSKHSRGVSLSKIWSYCKKNLVLV